VLARRVLQAGQEDTMSKVKVWSSVWALLSLAACDVTAAPPPSPAEHDAGGHSGDASPIARGDAAVITPDDAAVVMRDDAAVVTEQDASVVMGDDAATPDAGPTPSDAGPVTPPAETGWTAYAPSADSRVIHVATTGNDANDGSELHPVRTLAHGVSLLRDGMPDWLVLRRGDTWRHESFGNFQKSGRSASEPIVISSYGTGARPHVIAQGTNTFSMNGRTARNHVAIVGIHFDGLTDRGVTGPYGVFRTSPGTDFAIEDCFFEGYQVNIAIESVYPIDAARTAACMCGNGCDCLTLTDIRIRRSVIVDAYPIRPDNQSCTQTSDCSAGSCDSTTHLCAASHSQGIYLEHLDQILLEENVLDHNGWRAGVTGGTATLFNHDAYIQFNNSHVTVRGNVFANASSHGVQVRPGGIVEDNLLAGNPNAMSFGVVLGGDIPVPGGVTGRVMRNAILSAGDITPSLPRGNGIEISNIVSAEVAENLITRYLSAQSYGHGIYLTARLDVDAPGIGILAVNIHDNVVHDFATPFAMSSGGAAHGVVVTHNVFDVGTMGNVGTLVVSLNGFTSSDYTFMNNRYGGARYCLGSASNCGNFSWFTTRTGETTARDETTTLTYVHGDYGLASLQSALGTTARGADWLGGARLQQRGQWRDEYTGSYASRMLRAAHAPTTP
jgi:hypothetical protein